MDRMRPRSTDFGDESSLPSVSGAGFPDVSKQDAALTSLGVTAAVWIAAVGLMEAAAATFDRCLGRVPGRRRRAE
jgi:hypothetical protein